MLPKQAFVDWRAKALVGLLTCLVAFVLANSVTAPSVSSQSGSPIQDEVVRDAKDTASQPQLDIGLAKGDQPDLLDLVPPETAEITWRVTYSIWQGAVSSISDWAETPPAHGRIDVEINAAKIRAVAPRLLELMVAAAIAHQASDFKDRPFGTDAVEGFWVDHVDPDASIGIAQLRSSEVVEWLPELAGCDLMDPYNAIMIMTAKIAVADRYMRDVYGDLPITDRYMLLALVQNTSDRTAMQQTIDYFVHDAGRDWETMLQSELGQQRDWREQLRLILLQVDWLIEQNWQAPPGVDLEYWRRVAFDS